MDDVRETAQQQVWKRVFQRQEEPPRDDLRSLQMAAAELVSLYRYLQGVTTGKQRELVRLLYEGETATLAALKGVGVLSGKGEEVLKLWNPGKETGRHLLEKCYHKTRRCMVAYMGNSAEPEFGAVFRALADREARHCLLLAQLLGMK